MTHSPTVAVVHFPAAGHIRPMLPFVPALAGEGLRVVQWAPAEWERECAVAGGEFRALPDLSDLAWPEPAVPLRIAAFLGGLCERLTPWMSEQLQDAEADVVLRDTFAHYAHYGALASGLDDFAVSAMMAFHRGTWPRARDLPALVRALPVAPRLRASSRRLAARYGEPLGGPLSVLGGRHGSTTFAMTVPALQREPQRLVGEDIRYLGPVRALGPAEGGEEPALSGVGEDEQVILVSLGTVFEQQPGFFREAARALAAPGRRVILATGRVDRAELDPLPEGVTAHAHVDQIAVLRRANLFVSHAGFNSSQEALAAGVPLLLCPVMFEQLLNAEAVAAHGAALICRDPSVESIAAAAAELLENPSYADAAQRLAGEMRAGNRLGEGVELVAGAARAHAATRLG